MISMYVINIKLICKKYKIIFINIKLYFFRFYKQ